MAQVDIFKIEPDAYYAAKQVAQWAEIVPEYNLPAGKIFILGKGANWTHNQVLSRGMTHLQHNDVSGISAGDLQALQNAGKTYSSVKTGPEVLHAPGGGPNQWIGNYPNMYNAMYWPNGFPTYEQGFAIGQITDISDMNRVHETMENNHYSDPRSDGWAGFYDALMPRLIAKFGPNVFVAHDYLFHNVGPDWHNITEAQANAYFRNLPTLQNYDFITGGLKSVNGYCASGYLAMPDRDDRYVYDIALKGRMYKRLGKKMVCYFDPEREAMPNMLTANVVNGDTLYMQNKMPTPAPMAAGMVSAGLQFGNGFIGWNAAGKVTNKKWSTYWMQQLFSGSYWIKNGETLKRSSDTWPHLSGDMSYTFVNWGSCVDFAAFAEYQWHATMGQVDGGVTKYAKYKINDGPWYNPVNTFEDDLTYAKYHKAPIVETTVKDGKEGIYFIEPCSQNNKKLITIEGQTGKTHTFYACGNTPHLALATA
jgi:hypothetical protein